MEIRRMSKFSQIKLINFDEFNRQDKIIQALKLEDFQLFLIEYIPKEYIESYLLENTKQGSVTPTNAETPFDAQPRKTQEQIDLETALDTQLLNDPLGKYNGCNLRVPFDRGDTDWVEWVLKNMHNKFIRDKVALIKSSGYGA